MLAFVLLVSLGYVTDAAPAEACVRMKRFGKFWWDFIVGDDWRVAAGVVLAFGVTAAARDDVGPRVVGAAARGRGRALAVAASRAAR